MNIIHILVGGSIGGIEILCRDYIQHSKYNNIVLCLWGDGAITDEMVKNGVEVINLHTSSKKIFSTIKQVLNICSEKQADVVVEHHSAPLSHLCLMAIKRFYPQIKTVAYAHCNALDMYQHGTKHGRILRKFILVQSFGMVDRTIAISKFVQNSLEKEMNLSTDKISVIYNGISITKFQRERDVIKNNHIVFVGRLIEGKGVQVILHALSKLHDNFHFDIIGDGPYKDELEKIAKKLNLINKVTFHGSRSDANSFYAEASIFVHVPICEEGFGITVVEAMASGLTCVCSRSGGIPEILKDKETGYLVEKNNFDELATVLRKIIREYDSIENIRIRSLAIENSKKYTIEQYSEQLDKLFKSI